MIITISGMPGSGKSTIGKKLCEKYKLKRFSVGDFRRELAKKKGLSLAELNKIGEKERWTDEEADNWQINLGKKEDNFVIDGRISYFFIPNSIKIFLAVSFEEGAKRIGMDKREGENAKNMDGMIKLIKERAESDLKRYKLYYNINPNDKKNYDFVLDTTNLPIEEVFSKVVRFIENKK